MKKIKLLKLHLLSITLILSVTACQSPVEKPVGWTSPSGEVRPGPKTGKAVLALLSKARHASKQGSLNKAEGYLERAIRIEPQNPNLWLYMAKLRLYAAKSKESINLAKKALALSNRTKISSSARDSLQADCWRVIAHAHQKMGSFIKAQDAQGKAKALSH